MNILNTVKDVIQYLVEAATRFFTPSEDQYPEIGVQPFEGDAYSDR